MRNLLACFIIVPALIVAGCGEKRENMGIALDRGGHAAGEEQGGVIVQKKVAGPNEAYYTMGPDDTLYSVAKAHNVELAWLIKRNGFTTAAKAGTQVIVPARSTGGGAKPAAKK
jgi:hypothetical protein